VRPTAFLDRDGVLNELVREPGSGVAESPLEVDHVRLIPGAAAAAAGLARAGFMLVCVSNQPAAAKGNASVVKLRAIHEQVIALLAKEGVTFAAWRLCLHHPLGVVPELTKQCTCRKPAPGMLLDVAAELGVDLASSWMVGDTDADVAAGHAAGCRTLLIQNPDSFHKRLQVTSADLVAESLAQGAQKMTLHQLETFVKN
jgi:D-glycero-D-manno-heptose 1,7-bisphosphate phosphatase